VEKQEKEERIIDHRKKNLQVSKYGMKEERIIEIYHRKNENLQIFEESNKFKKRSSPVCTNPFFYEKLTQ
jgi:aminopeptidase-like protein